MPCGLKAILLRNTSPQEALKLLDASLATLKDAAMPIEYGFGQRRAIRDPERPRT